MKPLKTRNAIIIILFFVAFLFSVFFFVSVVFSFRSEGSLKGWWLMLDSRYHFSTQKSLDLFRVHCTTKRDEQYSFEWKWKEKMKAMKKSRKKNHCTIAAIADGMQHINCSFSSLKLKIIFAFFHFVHSLDFSE